MPDTSNHRQHYVPPRDSSIRNPVVVPAVHHDGNQAWIPAVQEYSIIVRYPEEEAKVRVGVRDAFGIVRGAIIRLYGKPNGEVGVSVESDNETARAVEDAMLRGGTRYPQPPPFRRQMTGYVDDFGCWRYY